MENRDIRIAFFDIDGTLLPPGDILISERHLAEQDRDRENGHKLYL